MHRTAFSKAGEKSNVPGPAITANASSFRISDLLNVDNHFVILLFGVPGKTSRDFVNREEV
jgi:hypothetical protein